MHAPTNRSHAIIAQSPSATTHFSPPSSPQPSLHGRRVLVLDDDPLAAVIASLDLEDAGAPFVLVHDERSAHAALDSAVASGEPFDAAVLDVNLGAGRTSRSVAERLRAMNVPFVLHTAEPDALADDLERRMQAGGGNAPVVGKPAPIGALTQELSRLLDPSR